MCIRDRHFSEYLDDVSELTRLVEERAPGVPAFLFGHSFGGLVATLAALDRPGRWRALVLSGPYFGLALHVPRVKLIAGKIASKLAPAFGLPSQLRGADMTHDAARILSLIHISGTNGTTTRLPSGWISVASRSTRQASVGRPGRHSHIAGSS